MDQHAKHYPLAMGSRLSPTWLRLIGKDRWVSTTATVFSKNWESLRNTAGPLGYHYVTYYYSVNGERYVGEFVDYGTQDEDYFMPNDGVEIKYNPVQPSKSYYPEVRSRRGERLVASALGAGMAVVVLTISLLNRSC